MRAGLPALRGFLSRDGRHGCLNQSILLLVIYV
jgi:hypothetical protein